MKYFSIGKFLQPLLSEMNDVVACRSQPIDNASKRPCRRQIASVTPLRSYNLFLRKPRRIGKRLLYVFQFEIGIIP